MLITKSERRDVGQLSAWCALNWSKTVKTWIRGFKAAQMVLEGSQLVQECERSLSESCYTTHSRQSHAWEVQTGWTIPGQASLGDLYYHLLLCHACWYRDQHRWYASIDRVLELLRWPCPRVDHLQPNRTKIPKSTSLFDNCPVLDPHVRCPDPDTAHCLTN